MIDRDELHRLFVIRGYSIRTIARCYHVSPGAVLRAIARYRAAEGPERWPLRPSPIHPRDAAAPPAATARHYRRGEPTLPPLPSLVGQ